MIRDIAFVALGGALGSVARYSIAAFSVRLWGTSFPWGILIVNAVGCLVMGMVVKIIFGLEASGADVRLQLMFWQRAVGIGFLGGLTTFSAFSADTALLLTNHRPGAALANVALNLILCLSAVGVGMWLIPGPK